jgi:hypothetical protein
MNTVGRYNNDGDERGHYTFGYYTEDGKHVNISFRAEPDYDLDIIFAEIKNFLIASGHDIQGDIGELGIDGGNYEDGDDSYSQSWGKEADDILLESIHAMKQSQSADKFSMDHLPNNGWPFGGLTTASIPALTTADLAPLTVTDLTTNKTYAYKDKYTVPVNQFPTMSPLTTQQIQSWSLSSDQFPSLTVADLSTWKMDAPGTLGGAKVKF